MWIIRLAGDRVKGGMGSAHENISARQAKIIGRSDDVIVPIRRNDDDSLGKYMKFICVYFLGADNACPCYWFVQDIINGVSSGQKQNACGR